MKQDLEIMLFGSGGRMGQEIQGLITENDLSLVGKVSQQTTKIEFSKRPNVVIDFSLPQGFERALSFAADHKIAFVSGTTGLNEVHFESLKAASKHIPVLWSPNMSVGINVFQKMIRELPAVAKTYDFALEEQHHIHKKDAPSGTALSLQKTLAETMPQKQLPLPVSIRGGGIFGIHKLWMMSEEETITIEHTALKRSVFAKGALLAARWLVLQPGGHYSFDDLLDGFDN